MRRSSYSESVQTKFRSSSFKKIGSSPQIPRNPLNKSLKSNSNMRSRL